MSPRERAELEVVELLGPQIREYVPHDALDHPSVWVSQCFTALARAVAGGDARAISLACDLISQDPKLPFGKLIKSDLARALKKQCHRLVVSERHQLLGATQKLLSLPYAPRELEDYGKLVRKFPRAEIESMLAAVEASSPKAKHIVELLTSSDA
jgi:hypothetical protein